VRIRRVGAHFVVGRMISLRKFWTADDPASDAEMRRVVRLLMQGIALHAVEGDPADHQKYRQDIQKLLDAVEAGPSAAELLVSTGSMLKTLENYNQRTTRYVRMQGTELHHMIAMLTRAVAGLVSASQKVVGRLQEIETGLEVASASEDPLRLKLSIADCLKEIRQEAERQKHDSALTTAALMQEIQGTQERLRAGGGGPAADPSTGLRARSAAIGALGEAALGPTPGYAALFIVDRVPLINSQLGYAAGDQVLKLYMEELHSRLPIVDQLFRWSGPAFLALLDRSGEIEAVREQLSFITPKELERTVELPGRSAPVSITSTWTVFPIALPLEELIEQLDGFVSSYVAPPEH
jgi:GGDEF domain-containing protein